MKGYNTLLGSHYDHYYLDYISFSAEKPAENVFVVDKGTTFFISIYWLHSWNSKTKWLIVSDVGACHSFPGPGVDHIYTFNPMREFVHGHTKHVDENFDSFREHHKKEYKDVTEHEHRRNIFRQNMRWIFYQDIKFDKVLIIFILN